MEQRGSISLGLTLRLSRGVTPVPQGAGSTSIRSLLAADVVVAEDFAFGSLCCE
jgi:hypothetical protein